MSAGDRKEGEAAFLAAAGALASGVAAQLGAPLREIRDALAVMVETLDRHFMEARGPEPYPWSETKALRERIAEIYLLSRGVTRLTNDLVRAVSIHRGAPETAEVNQLVEQAIALASHRIGEGRELSFDLGDLPPVWLRPGELVLLLARLLVSARETLRTAPGSGLMVATRREQSASGEGKAGVVIRIAAEAGGDVGDADEIDALARRVLEPCGGELRRSGPGQFEIRLPVAR